MVKCSTPRSLFNSTHSIKRCTSANCACSGGRQEDKKSRLSLMSRDIGSTLVGGLEKDWDAERTFTTSGTGRLQPSHNIKAAVTLKKANDQCIRCIFIFSNVASVIRVHVPAM